MQCATTSGVEVWPVCAHARSSAEDEPSDMPLRWYGKVHTHADVVSLVALLDPIWVSGLRCMSSATLDAPLLRVDRAQVRGQRSTGDERSEMKA